ncbi:MAG: phospho-sugar mutase [Clostridia bacterium]|nr:phospho-sugar mutase [Clostridia bacterium]
MYKDLYEEWLSSKKLSETEKAELKSLSENDIEYRFGKELEFGTAGMRGILGLGTNMLNVYTVRRATQALADYIVSLGEEAMKRGVAISYDTRIQSDEFAKESASVLAANKINAYLFDNVRPVPMLSFAVRHLNAVAGIMITASHNPKEYNGYKVYGEDGAQMSPEATEVVVENIAAIGSCMSAAVKYGKNEKKYVHIIGKDVDEAYYAELMKLTLSREAVGKIGKDIKLVYTPVHGSGYVPVTTMLNRIGINCTVVESQVKPDGTFPTVAVPNPEYKETLKIAIDTAEKTGADVVFGTDPDCDRLGVAIRNDEGEFVSLTGNETGVLLLDYVLLRLKETNTLPANGFIVKSFVTTSMAQAIAKDYGVELMETPVGFKFIGEKIKLYDDTGLKKFIFGFEESCGYLRGTHARDKDAVVASMLFAEMVCYYTEKGVSVYDRLQTLFKKYGYYFSVGVSKAFSGLNAMEEMNAVVDKMKTKKVVTIGGVPLVGKRDYSVPVRYDFVRNVKKAIDIPATNCVYYELQGGGFVCLRPSGTEPKLKIYYTIKAEDYNSAETLYEAVKADFEKILAE